MNISHVFKVCALGLKKNAVVICGDGVFRNGSRVGSNRFGPNLDQLRAGQTAGILVDSKCQLHLYVNGVDQGVAVKGITVNTFYGVADVYGQCEEVTIVPADDHDEIGGTVSIATNTCLGYSLTFPDTFRTYIRYKTFGTSFRPILNCAMN